MENVNIKKVRDHYEIELNGMFYCSCDVGELSETLNEIEKEKLNGLQLE